ncbi:unnamed protein product, partial [Didymodactylos carnosus]
ENNELVTKLKQLKTIIVERDNIIQTIKDKITNREKVLKEKNVNENESDEENEDEEEMQNTNFTSLNEILMTCTQVNSIDAILTDIDADAEKATIHTKELYDDIEERNKRIKELNVHLKKEHCKELETKLKVILELRERDAHLHIRQLGQSDAELRKARTDTDRIKILQQQLEFKQQQLDDIQKVAQQEQNKLNDEKTKHERSNHENWLEIKKLTRELESMKKECEGLRR